MLFVQGRLVADGGGILELQTPLLVIGPRHQRRGCSTEFLGSFPSASRATITG